MSYIIANENAVKFGEQFKISVLTGEEGADILEHKKTIIKLLENRFFNYQVDFIKGNLKGKEDKLYLIAEIINDISKDIETLEKAVESYHEKERQKK